MVFSLRIVNADFYTADPMPGLDPVYSDFRSSKIVKVPVIRIFGSTPNGQKCCLHIHGVFPYICVPYGGDEPRDAYLKQFATSVDFALHVSQGKASSTNRHVHNIEIISARSFYGYHDEEQEFMKVYFYNPFVITRVVELLQSGAVMNKTFQPYESHIPYIQQMFIDYNLYGMNLLNASSVMFRTPIQLKQDDPALYEDSSHSPVTPILSPSSITTGSPCEQFWTEDNVPRNCRHASAVERISLCELEVDVKAEHVMNQFEIGTSIGTNPGLLAIWQDEQQRRQDENDTSDLGPPISQERGKIPLLEAERRYKERLEQIIVDRNLMIQSQAEDHVPSSISPPPIEREPSSFDINENTPIVDHSIVEEVTRSSQRAFSQETGNTTDVEMIEILASLAESQSQSRCQDPIVFTSDDDEEDENERQEEEDSIVMSQQVWDDTDPAVMIDNADISGESNEHENTDGPGSQPLRMSQFDFQGLDETWEVSLLSEEPIPQVDGTNDDATGTPPPVRTSQKKRLFKRISYPTRIASTQKTRDISSPDDITSSVVVETGSKKRKVTRRLGMSSVRVTRRSQKTDLNEDDSKPLNDQPELGESEHLGRTVVRAKSSNPVASSKPIAQSKTNLPKVTRSKNTSPQFSLHLSESSSSAEESAISLKPLSKLSEIDYTGSKICAPEITHVTDLEIPHVKVSKTDDGSSRKMSLSLRSKPRRPSSLKNSQRDSSLVHMSDHISRARTRDTNEVTNLSSFESTRIRSLAQKGLSASDKEALPTDEVKRLKMCLEENDLPQKLDERHQTQQKEQRQHLKSYHYQQEQKRQQQQAESRQKGENCYKDIKRRVFSEFKCSGLKARTKKDAAELLGKDSIETTDLLNKTPLKTMRMHRKKQQRYTTSSKTPKSDSKKLELNSIEDISPKKESGKLDIRSSKEKTNNFNTSEHKVNETKSHESDSPKISLHDKLKVNIEKQESVTPNQNQNVYTQVTPQMKSFKIFLTDLASIDSKRYLYNAALERWKRQNNEQQKLKRIFSASHKSPLKRIVNFSSRQRRRNSSPRKSPQGKRYGVLDVTIHISSPPKASSEDQATPMSNRTASSPLKRARSSTFTKVQSQSQQSTDSYVSSSSNRSSSCTKTVFPSPPLTDTNSSSKCRLSTAFAVSPDKIQFKFTISPDSKRLSTPNKIANTKRKILTEIDRPSFPRQRQANEIDRLFDTLGSCLSKEDAYLQTLHRESGVQNELSEVGSGTEERNVNKYQDNADCVSAKQISIKEDGILTENLKRKRSDSNATCRKQPKLSLKLKQKTSSQVQKAPNDSEKYSNKKTVRDSANESAEFDEGSPAVTDRSSDSPSILDETIHGKSMSVEERSTPWKGQINSNFNNNDINSVCTEVAETKSQRNDVNEGMNTDEPLTFDSDETCDSAEMIRAKGNEHGDETNGRRTSVEEIEKQDPVLCSSPDLFDSALFNMSYLSPERCDEERSSPPLPFTPCKENDIQSKEEEPQGVATKQVQGACDLNSISEKYPFRAFSPAFHSNLSANVYSEDLNESSVNSSKLMVGLSQAPEKPARSLQTKKNEKFQNKCSASSAATVNRTCTTVSESKYVKQASALTELRRYCRQLEKEKLALMGLSVESSENSVSSSSAVEIPAVINHSSQDDLCSTRYSEISPSCSPNSACPKKDSSIESTSPFRGNVLSMGEKTCHANVADSTLGDNSFILPKELNLASNGNGNSSPIDTSTSVLHGNSPVDGSQAKSLLPTTRESSIEVDLHISNRPLIETSEENASLEQEKSQHNLVGSLSLTDDDDNNGMDHHSMISSDNDHSIQNENVDDEEIDRGNSSADKIDDGNGHSSPKHDFQEKELSGESTFLPHKDNSEFSVMNEQLTVIMPQREAPTATTLIDSLDEFGIPRCRYQEPFYSDPNDVPDSIMDVGGRLLKVQSNQVKTLQKFDTKSPFVGIQEVREIFYSSHENSFLHACQDNIGTSETFMVGIENNPELKVAFMGDKDLTITPCSIPPLPAVVRSWAQTKLTKNLQNALGDNKNAKLDKYEDKTSPVSKENLVEPVENRQTNLSKTESFHDKSKNDSLTGCGKASKAKCVSSTPNRIAPSSANSHDKEDRSNGATPDFPSNDPARNTKVESKTETGSPPNREEITSPNTLFSPVDKSFDSQSKNAVYDYDDNKKQSLNKTNSVERKTSDEQQERKKDAQHVFSFAFQSTPLPHKTKPKSGILSPSTATPATIVGLPRFPFLTPISTSTQVSSNSEKQTVNMAKSPSGEDAEKVRNSDVTPRRQLILSQLKLLTPEIALRRNLSEAGSDIEGPSPVNTAGYKVPQLNVQDAKASHEVQHLTLLSIELHVRTRKDKKPDPEFDPICAVFYHIQTDSPCPTNKVTGIICVDKDSVKLMNGKEMSKGSTILETSGTSIHNVTPAAKRPILERSGVAQYKVQYVEDEKDIFHAFLVLVRKCDPDILIGYELQMLSWGYLIQRALIFDLDLGKLLSRVTGSSSDCNVDAEKDQWGAAHSHELKIGGRIILNVWRLMRHEVALNIYSFENVAFHVLHERIPMFTFRSLSDWWDRKTDLHRWRTVEHYVKRCHGNIRLLEQVDFIGRTSELARLFGILFYSVISRGSQFRVESMMLRISKPLKYLAISPSVQQRNSMNAPEVIPLVLEPESRFYTNPVLVLDFQSLYPSMIIAYNYCYSTCLGRISCLEELGEFKFGASTLAVPPILIKKLKDDIHISPNGVAFVKSNVRLGVLPKMLEDILNTRIMVKTSMKKWKHKKSVHRMLDARQLGLKLIANVTYGYTAAHFSGRMPCVEIGDSIVRKARETLEHAIHVVNTTSKWGARVVYGDTDSMFVLLDVVSKDEAFNIGRDIAATITALNPKPVKLKFEKVYLPCVLQTKKRYVGYMYETPDQQEPVFDAKGIETVRRDSCPAVAKVLEKSLRLLFETKDVSLIKRYVQRQFSKVMEARVSLQDLTFAKEYRGMASYKPGACVPALELTRQMLKGDRRSEPRVGERVPYVIVYGSPGLPLIKLVRRPQEVLQDPSLRINALYYITKQLIPPLKRAFSLIGVDVSAWFAEVPRTSRVKVQPFTSSDARKKTISHYFTTTNCPVCQQTTTSRLCDACTNDPQKVAVTLNAQIRQHERRHRHLAEICYQCCGSRDTKLCCVSLDCPVFHKLVKTSRDLEPSNHLRELIATTID